MKSITTFAKEIGLTVEEIRLILSETNQDWDSVKELTKEEQEIISRVANAKLLGSSEIEHIGIMPLEHQKAIILTASEVLEHEFKLAIVEELEYHEVLAEVKNQAILHIHNQKKKELAAHFQAEHKNNRNILRGLLQEVSGMISEDVKLQDSEVPAKDELAVFMQGFKKKLIA
jgi:hypothetical protein